MCLCIMYHLVPKYKDETLNLGTGTVPEFWWKHTDEKECAHISAQRESNSGVILGHEVWT